jgi:hypothetical protein
MRLQQQDYVMADRIQRELLRRLPGDPVIAEFSKYLPSEALAQKKALNGETEEGDAAGEEDYYDEEEAPEKEEEYDKEEPEEPEEKEEDQQAEVVQEGAKAEGEPATEEKKGGENSEYEEEDDGYGDEDYDEEGRYKWGQEGADWDWYYKEDKEAYERGDPMPNTLNPPVYLDRETIEKVAIQASKENNHGNGMYKTKERKRPTGGDPHPRS